MVEETFYASAEVARQLGVNDATLRTWKSRYSDRLANAVADALTPQILQQIDQRIGNNVADAIATHMITVECVSVLKRIGLKPVDPATLIGAGRNKALPQNRGSSTNGSIPQLPGTDLQNGQNGNSIAGLLNQSVGTPEIPETAEAGETGADGVTDATVEIVETASTFNKENWELWGQPFAK